MIPNMLFYSLASAITKLIPLLTIFSAKKFKNLLSACVDIKQQKMAADLFQIMRKEMEFY